MSTDLDTRLRESIGRHMRAVAPPTPDVADLVRRGRQRRGLRVGGTSLLSAAAVAVVIVLGVSLIGNGPGSPGGAPDPAGGPAVATADAKGPVPVTGPTGLFVTRTKTYVDGSSYDVRLPWDTGAHVGRLGVAFPAPGSHKPSLLTRSGEVQTLAQRPSFPSATFDSWVAADGNGTLVAWGEQTPGATEIVAYDTATRKVVGRTTLRCHGSGEAHYCPRPYVVSDGTVFVAAYGGIRVWQPADATPGPLLGADVAQAHHRVLTTFEDRGSVPLDQVGEGWEQAHQPKGVEGILSYDGGWILDNGGDPRIVNWRHPEQTVTYRPPGRVAAATFDTDGSVLVVTSTGDPTSMGSAKSMTWTGWDCTVDGPCTVVVPEQKQEIRLVAWDL